MNAVFADTFYYLALVGRDDKARHLAEEFSQTWLGKVVTTAWVLTEVANALAQPPNRRVCAVMFATLQSDPHTLVVPPSAGLFACGWRLYLDRPDKGWSLTDCISFVVMQDRKLQHALTGDAHFEQAGFMALLKPRT